ncbi:peptidase inhibitor 16-like [Sinocyclocheilus rhinocerous]|uniref:peptidase inhibitor 16-like n=1 Tax=Sinocyclocheilus rhinocerous TaxID=307959 RepID=UPI0007B82DB8|nr:PREDICTED: peptidase inhibitor 16-like [Sinocyclocheilus rhinocerous]XP_016403952.1 PREDICTED: peptidase inhibitor 16-like [Sinocyclocheilus rhinocerous]
MYWNVALRSAGLWVILSLAAGHLTEQEKSTIVDMHNELRSKVQPSAAFMQKVVWDETLRLLAEAYAAKCIWDHNPQLKEFRMGENLFLGTGQFNATKAMMDWFGEHVDYDLETNNCPEDKMCGHYTQMVWADGNKIGCAAHFCDELEHLDFEKATLFVCNYYPQDNIEEQKPYESGVPCSRCPDTLPVCEDNMCVVEDLFHPSEGPGADPSALPERPRMTTEPAAVPEEPTQVHVKIETGMESEANHGSEMESVSAPLVMLVWLLVALVL